MRKNIYKTGLLAAVIAITSCNLTQNSTEEKTVIKESSTTGISAKVSEASVKSSLEYLASNELRGRETGTPGIEKAAVFIENKFKEAGLKPYFETYRDSFEVRGLDGYNMVGFLEGNDPVLKKEFVILGAHYDHVGVEKLVDGDSIANGANDNAAGTVAVIELAKHFGATKNNKRSMLFILFSAEEIGLQGAKHISSRLKNEGLDLYTLVNFEMIGVPMNNNEYLAYLTGFENSNMAEKFNEYANSKVLGFLPQAKEYSLFQRSDNYPFYLDFQVPSQTISTFDFTNYEFYHHVADEASRMNYPHMVNLIEKVIPGISGIVNSASREIKMNE